MVIDMLIGAQVQQQLLDSDLNLSEVADNPEGAVAFLARSGDTLRLLNRANVFCRVLLGRQLLIIQERRLWTHIERLERSVGNQQNGPRDGYRSWDDFMSHGFPEITGLGKKTGYAAVMLAKAKVLQKLSESDLRKFDNLANAIHLVKLERRGVLMSPELTTAAQTLSVDAFLEMTCCEKKAIVEAVVDNSSIARALQPIITILKMAEPEALLGLREVLEHAMIQAGGNATDAVDCVIAACLEQWRQEGLPELATVRSLGIGARAELRP